MPLCFMSCAWLIGVTLILQTCTTIGMILGPGNPYMMYVILGYLESKNYKTLCQVGQLKYPGRKTFTILYFHFILILL